MYIQSNPRSIRACVELGRVNRVPPTKTLENKVRFFLHGDFSYGRDFDNLAGNSDIVNMSEGGVAFRADKRRTSPSHQRQPVIALQSRSGAVLAIMLQLSRVARAFSEARRYPSRLRFLHTTPRITATLRANHSHQRPRILRRVVLVAVVEHDVRFGGLRCKLAYRAR